jgi:hypothetical protein
MRKLVYEGTNNEVHVGDCTKTFRGEMVRVKRIVEPRHDGSTGRVLVRYLGGRGYEMEYYPGVIRAHWVDVN